MRLPNPQHPPLRALPAANPDMPAAMRGHVHFDEDTRGIVNARVLVVDDGARAGYLALELYDENEVCIVSANPRLQGVDAECMMLLCELHAEDELPFRGETRIEGVLPTLDGRCEVFFRAGTEYSARFDHIFFCGRATRSEGCPAQGDRRHSN